MTRLLISAAAMLGMTAANFHRIQDLKANDANVFECQTRTQPGEKATYNPMCITNNGGLGCVESTYPEHSRFNGCQFCEFGDYAEIPCQHTSSRIYPFFHGGLMDKEAKEGYQESSEGWQMGQGQGEQRFGFPLVGRLRDTFSRLTPEQKLNLFKRWQQGTSMSPYKLINLKKWMEDSSLSPVQKTNLLRWLQGDAMTTAQKQNLYMWIQEHAGVLTPAQRFNLNRWMGQFGQAMTNSQKLDLLNTWMKKVPGGRGYGHYMHTSQIGSNLNPASPIGSNFINTFRVDNNNIDNNNNNINSINKLAYLNTLNKDQDTQEIQSYLGRWRQGGINRT